MQRHVWNMEGGLFMKCSVCLSDSVISVLHDTAWQNIDSKLQTVFIASINRYHMIQHKAVKCRIHQLRNSQLSQVCKGICVLQSLTLGYTRTLRIFLN